MSHRPSPPPHDSSRSASTPSGEESLEPFDPYKFQSVPVSPELRQELLAAKLPRLDSKYFEDTVPPGGLARNDGDPPKALGLRAQIFAKIAILALLLAIAAAVVVAFWRLGR